MPQKEPITVTDILYIFGFEMRQKNIIFFFKTVGKYRIMLHFSDFVFSNQNTIAVNISHIDTNKSGPVFYITYTDAFNFKDKIIALLECFE